MTFAKALDADSQLLVLGFMERDSLDAIQLTCQYLYDFVEGSTSLPLRRLECLRIEVNNDPTGHGLQSLTVERNGEREVMEADSTCVAVKHFFIYMRNSYCGEIGIAHVDLSVEFIDRLVALHDRFKTNYFVMTPVRFIDAHRDSSNSVDLDLILRDRGMPKIDYAGHTVRIENEYETTHTFASNGWTMEVRVDKHGYFSVCRFKAGSQHSCRCPMRVPEIPTKKRRIL